MFDIKSGSQFSNAYLEFVNFVSQLFVESIKFTPKFLFNVSGYSSRELRYSACNIVPINHTMGKITRF